MDGTDAVGPLRDAIFGDRFFQRGWQIRQLALTLPARVGPARIGAADGDVAAEGEEGGGQAELEAGELLAARGLVLILFTLRQPLAFL